MAPRDYFAELYVAGLMADAGWNLYFPHRDRGMDFIATKTVARGTELIRAVQVKGKYPTAGKGRKVAYGYVGKLNQLHPEMVLAIPFFANNQQGPPMYVAYMPFSRLKPASRGRRCQPCTFRAGVPTPRREYLQFFDDRGLAALERSDFSTL